MAQDDTRILAGRYQVGELIGRGGMAEVHIGHDTRLGRTVAIKVLRSDLARDPSFQARFRREAQAAAALNHPSIVAVYDTGEDVFVDPNGVQQHVPFIVMEYVEGHTVRDILRDGHAVPIEEAIEIIVGVLSALEYSHHAGIVHRDIKPANVMLTPTGAVKVMDFGIARAVADSGATMTQTQAVIGTAQYLSPEQARGESVDARSDLYSTGCLLFELLTGRAPFVGDSPVSVAYQHVREAAPVPSSLASDVPEVLDRITLKALAKDRESRYTSAADFRADLEAAVRGGIVTAPPASAYAAGATTITPAIEEPAAPAATQVFAPAAPATAPTQAFTPGAGMPWAPTQPGTPGMGTGALPVVDEDDDDEGTRPWIMWTLIGVAVAAVVGIIFLFMSQDREEPITTVDVPAMGEMTKEAAEEALAAVNLRGKFLTEPHDTVDEGLVTRAEPVFGTPVDPDSEVTVYLSSGPAEVTIPDVSGETQARARQILQDAGLEVSRVETRNEPGVALDIAIETDPPADSPAKVGDSVVLVLASGQVDLPDLLGKERGEVEDLLDDELLLRYIITEEETDEYEPGQISFQSPGPGNVSIDTRVELRVAIEPVPTTATIPNELIGMQFEEARERLESLDLRPRWREEESDQPPGTVLYTEPGVGTEVDLDSIVTLVLAKAPVVTDPPTTDPPEDPPTTEPPGDEDGDGDGDGGTAATQPTRRTNPTPRRR